MADNSLRFRQVHLDFHTSEHITGIGSEFDPERFVHSLKAAHVDSVTLFSRCHHGWIYHDTKFPLRHPHLTSNLLAEQIRACHAADIRCPIYITVGWDQRVAREEPGWREVHEDGRNDGAKPLEAGWNKLCFASPYIDFVQAQTDEVLELFGDEVDGLFFDILFVNGVHSPWALAKFAEQGLDPANKADQRRMKEHILAETIDRISGTVRARNKTCGMFFNSGHVAPHFRPIIDAHYSHLEVESLPTGGWGYAHFPIAARYSRTLGKQYLGMTGKFGETWGHFNSYKPAVALEYETRLMLALGGRCSVGDQLHPRGVLDPATYELIGSAYAQIEALEPWHVDAVPAVDIAVVHTEPYATDDSRVQDSNVGAYRLLTELRQQFDFVDEGTSLDSYRVLVLPDVIPVSATFAAKIEAFLAAGGSLILTGGSGADLAFAPGTAVSGLDFRPGFVDAGTGRQFVVYSPLVGREATAGAEVLAEYSRPYFNRSFDHFCSHAHAPIEGPSGFPAVLAKGSVVQVAFDLFAEYANHPALEVKALLASILGRLLPVPLVAVEGPSTLQAHALWNGDSLVVHLMSYLPERRGTRLDIVEDRLPVRATTMRVRGAFGSAVAVPEGSVLVARVVDGVTEVEIPDFDGALVVVLGA
jgi:Hypothetical glycosyl hydrolase 6/Beta-galactosidase trimerisation domain